MSSLVMSSKTSLEDAVKTASMLKNELRETQISCQENHDINDEQELDDKTILHKAVGILRTQIQNFSSGSEYDYPLPYALGLESASSYVPLMLIGTM